MNALFCYSKAIAAKLYSYFPRRLLFKGLTIKSPAFHYQRFIRKNGQEYHDQGIYMVEKRWGRTEGQTKGMYMVEKR